MIKHLAISGGLVYGFSFYGVLRYLVNQKFFETKSIETIHATSVGSIVAVVLALEYEWEVTDKYFIDRPWEHVFQFSLTNLINCVQNNGLFGVEAMEDILSPLLQGKDLSKDITLKDFHEVNGISIHFMTVDISSFELTNVSHKTHPDWRLVDAVYASSCAPIIFRPFVKENIAYADGAFLANYPIQPLLDDYMGLESESILGLRLAPLQQGEASPVSEWTIYEYLWKLIAKVIRRITPPSDFKHKYCITLETNIIPEYDLFSIVNSIEHRRKLIEYGSDCAEVFMNSLTIDLQP